MADSWSCLKTQPPHPCQREFQLGFIVNSPLDWLMTEQPLSTLSIWDFTAAVYKWDFHDKQLCIRFRCISKSENDLLRLCWEGVVMKTKNISGYFPQEHYHDDNTMTLFLHKYFKSKSSSWSSSSGPPCTHAPRDGPRSPLPAASIPPSHDRLKRMGSAISSESFLQSLIS